MQQTNNFPPKNHRWYFSASSGFWVGAVQFPNLKAVHPVLLIHHILWQWLKSSLEYNTETAIHKFAPEGEILSIEFCCNLVKSVKEDICH